MDFQEALEQLRREDVARHVEWAKERESRIAAGTPYLTDTLFMDPGRTPWWRARWWAVERFLRDQVWHHYWANRLKHFWQRGRRGWGDNDWWNLSNHLSEILPGMLRRMATRSHGYPCDIYDENGRSMVYEEALEGATRQRVRSLGGDGLGGDEGQAQLWSDTLERMARGFEAWSALCDLGWNRDSEAEKELLRYFREGFMLMYHNWDALWD